LGIAGLSTGGCNALHLAEENHCTTMVFFLKQMGVKTVLENVADTLMDHVNAKQGE